MSYCYPSLECESRAIYLPYDTYEKPNNLVTLPIPNDSHKGTLATATPYKYLGSEKATVLKIFIAAPKRLSARVFSRLFATLPVNNHFLGHSRANHHCIT